MNKDGCVILHVDADGFFAAVEQALTPALRGCPVVTGAERGIIAAASYEARALGVKRGLQLHEARALCPDLVTLPSDYQAYGIYSRRLHAIVRRFSPHVEEYSIDEAFADLSGCGALLKCGQEGVAQRLRQTVSAELGLTVSVGVSTTKTLAKLCSKFRKPDNQTIVRREHIALLLRRTPVEGVWGIGPASVAKLRARGVRTAHDFAAMPREMVVRLLHKPGLETWLELHGQRVFPLVTNPKARYESMMKGHTFSPPGQDRHLIFAEALRNMTGALAKLRARRHLAREIGLSLRRQDYATRAAKLPLPMASNHDHEMAPLLRRLFDSLFRETVNYRATTVWLGALVPERNRQMELFEDTSERRALTRLDHSVDHLNQRYGEGTIVPATLLELQRKPPHPRDARPARTALSATGAGKRNLLIPCVTLPNPI